MRNLMQSSTLYAFYDFEVSGYDFDFLCFLTMSEWTRRRVGASRMHVVFVPETKNGGLHGKIHDDDLRHWRLSNILIPGCRLLPATPGFSSLGSRDEAKQLLAEVSQKADNYVFPEGYTVEDPIPRWLSVWLQILGNYGEPIQYLRATPKARAYIAAWKADHIQDQRLVTITLRYAPYNPQRNSNLKVWAELTRRLKDAGYFPAIIPDTETALQTLPPEFKGIAQVPPAAFNLELRAAMYEESFLNLFVSNGTAMVAMLDKHVRFIQFLSGEWIRNAARVEKSSGIPLGNSYAYLNRYQKISWLDQHVDAIWNEFQTMAERLDQDTVTGAIHDQLVPEPAYREDDIPLLNRLCRFQHWDEFDFTMGRAMANSKNNAELYRLIGLAEIARVKGSVEVDNEKICQAFSRCALLIEAIPAPERDALQWEHLTEARRVIGQIETAERELHNRVMTGQPEQSLFFLLGEFYESQGRISDSVATYERGIAAYPNDAEMRKRLVGVLKRDGNADDARNQEENLESLLRSKLQSEPESVNAALELGAFLEAHNMLPEARDVYRSGVERMAGATPLYFRLGTVLQRLGDDDGAITIFKSCILLDDRKLEAYERLGLLFESQQQLECATEIYQAALSRGVASLHLLHRLGAVLFGQNLLKSSEEIFQWLVKHEQADETTWKWIAKIEDKRKVETDLVAG